MKLTTYNQAIYNAVIESLEAQLSGKKPALSPAWDNAINPIMNPITGKTYRGDNIIRLWTATKIKGHESELWAGLKQWNTQGHSVKKGEAGIPILTPIEVVDKNSENEKKTIFTPKTVFNAQQIQGYKPEEHRSNRFNLGQVELLLKSAKIDLRHVGNLAMYSPKIDAITMPPQSSFLNEEGYFSTLFHEITHWARHPSRCNRRGEYAFEELVAELGASFLCGHFGIDKKRDQTDEHAAYLGAYLELLKGDDKALWKAANAAQKAVDFLLQHLPENPKTKEQPKQRWNPILAAKQLSLFGGTKAA